MKTIFRSFFIIAAVAAIAGVGTYAWYTSTASVIGSTFSAGTMNLKVDSNPASDIQDWVSSFTVPQDYFITNLYPGYPAKGEHNWQVIDIQKQGDVDGTATLQLNATQWTALGDNLVFEVLYAPNNDNNWTHITSGTLAQFQGNTYDLGAITGLNKIASVKIVWSVPTSAGNNIQGQSVTLDAVFGLTQVQ